MDPKDVNIPLASYTFKILKASKEVSKGSGHQMFKLECELVDEPRMLVDGEEVDVNGLQPKPKYISPIMENTSGDPKQPTHEATNKALKTVNEFRGALQPTLDPLTKEDLANQEAAHLVGRKFVALASSKTEPMMANGREVINKLTGKPIMTTSFEIGRVLTANG